MSIQRTIQHPGVETREIDKSQYTPSIEGTYCLLAGYADKGEELNPLIVSNSQSFDTIYGYPTNEAERYFYYAGQEILRTGGTLVAAKLPYDNIISDNYKAFGITFSTAETIVSSDRFDTSVSGNQLIDVGYEKCSTLSVSPLHNLSRSHYDQLQAGLTMDSATFPPGSGDMDFIIVNDTKEAVHGVNENNGIFVAVVDPIDAMNIQRVLDSSSNSDIMELLSGFSSPSNHDYIGGTYDLSGNYTRSNDFTVDLFNTYDKTSISENIMRQFPTIEFLSGGSLINKEYSHHMGIVVCQAFSSEQQEGKFKVGIIEAFVGSIHDNARDLSTGQSIYIADLVNAGSRYLKMFYNVQENNINSTSYGLQWSQEVQDNDTVLYKASDVYPLIGFTGAESVKSILGASITSEMKKVYEKVSNIDEIQIDLVIDAGLSTIGQFTDDVTNTYIIDDQGNIVSDSGGGILHSPSTYGIYDPVTDVDPTDVLIQDSQSLATWRQITSTMIDFCKDTRKDCMAIVDVPRHLVLEGDSKYIRPTKPDQTFSTSIGPKLKYITGLNSSYAALYGNWFRMVDGTTGTNFWIPQSVKMAGIYIYNDRIANIWDAPAGLNRGIIYGVNDLAYNPNDKDADQLYLKSINYAKKYPLDGFIAEGQKTTQVKPSAFDRVNVRRLFLRLERLVYEVSRYFVYEPNNYFTRRRLVDMVDPIFSRIKQQGGIYDYRIVCSEDNNTPDVIDRNELKIAFFIKPVKTAEFILVDFVAVRTGTDFNEVINEVI